MLLGTAGTVGEGLLGSHQQQRRRPGEEGVHVGEDRPHAPKQAAQVAVQRAQPHPLHEESPLAQLIPGQAIELDGEEIGVAGVFEVLLAIGDDQVDRFRATQQVMDGILHDHTGTRILVCPGGWKQPTRLHHPGIDLDGFHPLEFWVQQESLQRGRGTQADLQRVLQSLIQGQGQVREQNLLGVDSQQQLLPGLAFLFGGLPPCLAHADHAAVDGHADPLGVPVRPVHFDGSEIPFAPQDQGISILLAREPTGSQEQQHSGQCTRRKGGERLAATAARFAQQEPRPQAQVDPHQEAATAKAAQMGKQQQHGEQGTRDAPQVGEQVGAAHPLSKLAEIAHVEAVGQGEGESHQQRGGQHQEQRDPAVEGEAQLPGISTESIPKKRSQGRIGEQELQAHQREGREARDTQLNPGQIAFGLSPLDDPSQGQRAEAKAEQEYDQRRGEGKAAVAHQSPQRAKPEYLVGKGRQPGEQQHAAGNRAR